MLKTYLCFDLGTTKIKSAIIDKKGDIIYICSKIAKSYAVGEAVIQKPEEYYQTVLNEIMKMKKKFPAQFKNADSLIFSGQMAGILAIDKNWEIIIPWTNTIDTRANKYLFRIEEKFGNHIRISSGGVPIMAAKIKWIMEEFKNDYKKIAKFINLTSYIAGKLCGLSIEEAFIDYSVLSMSGLAEIENGIWNKEICNLLDVDEKKLPLIKKPYEIIGYIDKKIYNTNDDIKVLVGIGDQIAGFIGAGIIRKGSLVDVAGTYTVIGYCTDRPAMDFKEKIITSINSGFEGIYYQLVVAAVGGYLYNWFLEKFNYDCSKKFKEIIKTNGLYFIPHVGGRLAPSQPYYQGTWYGIKWQHDLDSFYISILESLGYEFFMLLEKIKRFNQLEADTIKDIRVIGGGSKNIFWNRIKSSIMNLDYNVMKEIPFEIFGIFLIARYGTNLIKGVDNLERNKVINIKEKIKPNKKDVEYYNLLKKNYSKIVEKISKVYKEFS